MLHSIWFTLYFRELEQNLGSGSSGNHCSPPYHAIKLNPIYKAWKLNMQDCQTCKPYFLEFPACLLHLYITFDD